ncbi:helix-turn-helix domain-containing protein [Nocardia farcinica]|uniref:helix-turn-helix domain-containing protein n=1 Tax=Nocardia farcinica TaxID=37329 RepID=UPI00189586A0|nr:helix-turn-helix transcriptional regulator [Nocardia farcinica]MBF6185071.1 helix-turn-helix transcriptional regulator [Nocardia farcinica]MBF6363961.1 helix-turn-helix transcriptional regulator [Nocardia farcinica]
MGIDGGLIRAARRARGWSQTRLIAALRERAEIDHVPLMSAASLRIALSRWENNHHVPDEVHTDLLCRVLDLTPSPASASSVIPAPTDPPDDSLYGVLAHHTNSLRLLDRRLGAPVVRQQTASHVASLEQLWHNRTGVDQLSVARAQADAASLVAWQDLDLGDHKRSADHYRLARVAASRAGDSTLLAHAVGEHAVMLAETGRSEVAYAQVRRAEGFPGLPPLLRSWLAATRAQIAAALTGEQDAVLSGLQLAETALAQATAGDEVDLPFVFLDAVHLARWQGHILIKVGDPAGRQLALDALDQLPEDFVRARCAQQLDLAEDALRRREVEPAEALLTTVAIQIQTVGSARLGARHAQLRRVLNSV